MQTGHTEVHALFAIVTGPPLFVNSSRTKKFVKNLPFLVFVQNFEFKIFNFKFTFKF